MWSQHRHTAKIRLILFGKNIQPEIYLETFKDKLDLDRRKFLEGNVSKQ